MRVFNLTSSPLDYKGKTISPNGGFVDFPSVSFVPDRDRKLEQKRVLAFDALPSWFVAEQELKAAQEAPPKIDFKIALKVIEVKDDVPVEAQAEASTSSKDQPKAKKS